MKLEVAKSKSSEKLLFDLDSLTAVKMTLNKMNVDMFPPVECLKPDKHFHHSSRNSFLHKLAKKSEKEK